jgi:hypothetical protein
MVLVAGKLSTRGVLRPNLGEDVEFEDDDNFCVMFNDTFRMIRLMVVLGK